MVRLYSLQAEYYPGANRWRIYPEWIFPSMRQARLKIREVKIRCSGGYGRLRIVTWEERQITQVRRST